MVFVPIFSECLFIRVSLRVSRIKDARLGNIQVLFETSYLRLCIQIYFHNITRWNHNMCEPPLY